MAETDKLRSRLDQADAIENLLDRRLFALSIVTERLSRDGIRPILVGGAAVELYTAGGYSTRDMDLIMPVSRQVDTAMQELGFTSSGRYWVREDLGLVVEAPSDELAGDMSRVVELEVEASQVYVIGVEDLIIDRLNAFVHWRSAEDGRWAERMLSIEKDSLDLEYLRKRADDAQTLPALDAMLQSENRL